MANLTKQEKYAATVIVVGFAAALFLLGVFTL